MTHRAMQLGGLLALSVLVSSALARADDKAPTLVGTWTWSWKDAEGVTHKHVLEVEGTGDKLAAREIYDDQEAIKVGDLKRNGKKVTFSVLRGKRQSNYSGELKAENRIEGTVNVTVEGQTNEFGWEAKRDQPKK